MVFEKVREILVDQLDVEEDAVVIMPLPAMASASLMTRTGRQSLCTAQRDLGSSR